LNVEDVLIGAAVGRFFALLAAAVQIQDVDVVESLQQVLAHPAKGRVIIGHVGKHAVAGLINAPG